MVEIVTIVPPSAIQRMTNRADRPRVQRLTVGVLGLLDGLNDADAARAGVGEVGGQLVRVHTVVSCST